MIKKETSKDKKEECRRASPLVSYEITDKNIKLYGLRDGSKGGPELVTFTYKEQYYTGFSVCIVYEAKKGNVYEDKKGSPGDIRTVEIFEYLDEFKVYYNYEKKIEDKLASYNIEECIAIEIQSITKNIEYKKCDIAFLERAICRLERLRIKETG